MIVLACHAILSLSAGGCFVNYIVTLISALPSTLYLRDGDAIHLAAAQGAGFAEIWSSDKSLLAAAPHFGLAGKSV
jgi:predicted nucleic acid-binding protein